MSGVNKVILIGRLGSDVDLKYTAASNPVANFSIATSEKWKDKAGQMQEKTEWHRIVVWGKLAELCNQYLKKGKQAFIEGSLATRQWENKEGVKQYTTEINARSVQFLDSNDHQDQKYQAQESGAQGHEFTADQIPF